MLPTRTTDRLRRIVGSALLASALSLTGTGLSYAQASSAGSISALRGKVTIVRSGQTLNGTFGTPVEVGDEVSTGPNSLATLTMADGSQMELTESSSMVVERNDLNPDGSRAATDIKLVGGLLHSLVRHAPGNTPNYEVHTPNAVAAARGTDFDTSYAKGVERKEFVGCREFSDVSVYEGKVEVTNPTNPSAGSVQLKKGQKTTIPCGLLLAPAAAIGPLIGLGAAGAAAAGTAAGVTVAVTSGGTTPPVSPSQ